MPNSAYHTASADRIMWGERLMEHEMDKSRNHFQKGKPQPAFDPDFSGALLPGVAKHHNRHSKSAPKGDLDDPHDQSSAEDVDGEIS